MFIGEVISRLIFTDEFNAATSDTAATANTATIANSSASTAPKTT